MTTFIENLHFLRPWLLLLLPLGLLCVVYFSRYSTSNNDWKKFVDERLLSHLFNTKKQTHKKRFFLAYFSLFWLIACLAIAGPSFRKLPQPVNKNHQNMIILLDLSLSMYAEDQQPSRLVQAKREIEDLLNARKDGFNALIAYAGDAHVVTPLTDDKNTIMSLLPVLEPAIMPKYGSNLPLAIEMALSLIDEKQIPHTQILIITDEIINGQFTALARQLQQGLNISILMVGTESGAPFSVQGKFLKDKSGSPVMAKLNKQAIQQFCSQHNLRCAAATTNDADMHYVWQQNIKHDANDTQDREFDIWQDEGQWLTLLLLPLFLLFFRRGSILCLFILLIPDTSYALDWEDLWKTDDQQAAEAFQQGDYEAASEQFSTEQWRAAAAYEAGNYEQAITLFNDETDASSLYNKGNAMAKSGQIDQAISLYEKALSIDPAHKDAAFNMELLKQLKKQSEEQSQQGSQQQESQQNQQDQTDQSQTQNAEKNQQQSEQAQQASSQNQEMNEEQAKASQPQDQEDAQNNAPESPEEQTHSTDDAPEEQEQDEETDVAQSSPMQSDLSPEELEEQQALEHWLRAIPDTPGTLLRNKFQYQHQQNRQQGDVIDKESNQPW